MTMGNEGEYTWNASDVEISYFELQAYTGTTKHMGGLATTKELIRLCRVGADTHVLDVGCGVGATACYLAGAYGCRVAAVDLRKSMIARSRERAKKEGVEHRVDFRVVDALDMPFEDSLFDVVLCESVATFIEDKQQVIREFVRVVKPGGYLGLNEEIWIRTPPDGLAEDAKRIFDIEPDILTVNDWQRILEDAGLRDVFVKPYEFNTRRESSQLGRYRWGDMLRMFYRTVALSLKRPDFREYMKKRRQLPKDVFRYFGYCLFVCRK
jgi:SAM-dependent methyltransferase